MSHTKKNETFDNDYLFINQISPVIYYFFLFNHKSAWFRDPTHSWHTRKRSSGEGVRESPVFVYQRQGGGAFLIPQSGQV